MRTRPVAVLFAAAALAVAARAAPAAPADDSPLDGHLEAKAPAIVSVKYVWKSSDSESNQETRGVMVDPSGLIMLTADSMSGEGAATDIKILFSNEAKEWDSVLVVKDSLLDLAYVQILDPEGKTFDSVDLSKGGSLKVGQSLFGVTRGSRGFDFAPAIRRLYVAGKVEKPRPMWDIGGDFTEAGLPVFDLTGTPVGVIVNQQGSEGADEGQRTEAFLLPLEAVMKSLVQAKKRVPDAVAKGKASKEKPPKEEPKVEPPAMGDAEKPPTPEQPPK